MQAWLFAILSSPRVLVSPPPFTANATFVAPTTTSSLATLTGQGAAGTPASSYDQPTWQQVVNTTYQKRAGGTDETNSFGSINDGAPPRANYCDAFVSTPDNLTYSGYTTCYYYLVNSRTVTIPATTGASTTAFGKTFAGGTGGAATPVTYNNVALTPGQSYGLVVPTGGSVSITYWK